MRYSRSKTSIVAWLSALLMLVATDYAGVTDIFPFVNKSK
jgi:hypothetical protein